MAEQNTTDKTGHYEICEAYDIDIVHKVVLPTKAHIQ